MKRIRFEDLQWFLMELRDDITEKTWNSRKEKMSDLEPRYYSHEQCPKEGINQLDERRIRILALLQHES